MKRSPHPPISWPTFCDPLSFCLAAKIPMTQICSSPSKLNARWPSSSRTCDMALSSPVLPASHQLSSAQNRQLDGDASCFHMSSWIETTWFQPFTYRNHHHLHAQQVVFPISLLYLIVVGQTQKPVGILFQYHVLHTWVRPRVCLASSKGVMRDIRHPCRARDTCRASTNHFLISYRSYSFLFSSKTNLGIGMPSGWMQPGGTNSHKCPITNFPICRKNNWMLRSFTRNTVTPYSRVR